MNKKVFRVLAMVILAALTLAACATPATPTTPVEGEQPSPTEPGETIEPTESVESTEPSSEPQSSVPVEFEVGLLQKTWLLDWMVDQNVEQRNVLEGSEITLEFGLGMVNGSSGCNTYNGPVQSVDGTLQIGPLATTMMACEESIMEQEIAYLEALQKVVNFSSEGENVVGKDDNGQVLLSFTELAPVPLEGTLWEVVNFNNGQNAVVSVLAGTKITAQFSEDGKLSGNSSCNSYFGSFTTEDGKIQIGPVGGTEMFCTEPEGIMDQEQAYLSSLPSATEYKIVGDQLELRTADGALVVSYQAVQPKPLVGTFWILTGYNNGNDGFSSVLTASEITALFSTDGKLTGSAGCNNYMTSFTMDGTNLTVDPAASTRMACAEPEGIMEQETAYLNALNRVVSYMIVDSQLTLLDENGTRQVEFIAHPLIGEIWMLTAIQYMDDTSASPVNPQDYTVQFSPDGTVAIKADCNQVAGSYTIEGESLSIQLGPTTTAFCGDESLDQQFLEQLGMAASYIIQGDLLYIATQMDSSIMNFVQIP